jgi:hypothetical protein
VIVALLRRLLGNSWRAPYVGTLSNEDIDRMEES